MKTLKISWIAGLLFLFAIGGFLPAAEDYGDLEEMTLEELLQITITTASKVGQTVLETPVAVTVIERADIENTGVHSIPELLRNAAGIELRMFDHGDVNVGMRGNLDPPENSILVLIDGKNIYQNFFGLILWESLPITVDEIERIEIIRGPASSLYGANAFNGVINIITRKITDEVLVHVGAGESGDLYDTLLFARKHDRFGYRIGVNYRSIDSLSPLRDDAASEVKRGNFKLSWDLKNEAEFTLFCGMSGFDGHLQIRDVSYVPYRDGEFSHLAASYSQEDLSVLMYWNRSRAEGLFEILLSPGPNVFDLEEDVFTLEYQQSWSVDLAKGRNRLTWGLNYQYNEIRSVIIDSDRSQKIPSLFFQDEYRPNEEWILMAGLRFDDHPVTGEHYSPRGSVTRLVNNRHAFRLGYGEAFKNPTILENYFDFTVGMDFTGDGIPDAPAGMVGNRELESEEIKNLEIGYRGTLLQNLTVGLSLFRFEQSDLITYTWVDPDDPYNLFNTFLNMEEDQESMGAELELDTKLSPSSRFRVNYRWIDDPVSCDVFTHVLNAELNVQMGEHFRANLRGNWNGDRDDPEIVPGEAEDLLLFHGMVSYSGTVGSGKWTLYVSGFNLLDEDEIDIAGSHSMVPLSRVISGGVKLEF